VIVPPILVRRLKSHFVALPCGVDLILGLNGYVWVSKHIKESQQEGEEGFDAESVYSNQNDVRCCYVPCKKSALMSISVYRRRNSNCYISRQQHNKSASRAFCSSIRYNTAGSV
jgi:exosome complex RNA-binding protein Rrp4